MSWLAAKSYASSSGWQISTSPSAGRQGAGSVGGSFRGQHGAGSTAARRSPNSVLGRKRPKLLSDEANFCEQPGSRPIKLARHRLNVAASRQGSGGVLVLGGNDNAHKKQGYKPTILPAYNHYDDGAGDSDDGGGWADPTQGPGAASGEAALKWETTGFRVRL